MTAAIVGSRWWNDYVAFCAIVSNRLPKSITRIVSGGASGVDAMAERFAKDNGYIFTMHHPDEEAGKSFTQRAHSRNQRIVNDADYLIALPGPESKGTYDTIRRARRKGIPIAEVEVPE